MSNTTLPKPTSTSSLQEPLLLENIQPNILHSHGKDHVKCLFIKFNEPRIREIEQKIAQEQEQSLIQKLKKDRDNLRLEKQKDIRSWISCTARQLEDDKTIVFSAAAAEENWKKKKIEAKSAEEELVACVFLSAKGYQKMGIADSFPDDEAFRRGMGSKETRDELTDGKLQYNWEGNYRNGEIHMMILLATNDPKRFDPLVDSIERGLNQINGQIFVNQDGSMIKSTNSVDRFEHFGYKDSISKSPDAVSYALVQEPGHKNRWGSYLVFRKLEQNVKIFNSNLDNLEGEGVSRAFAEAQVIGRYKDGVPVMFKDPSTQRRILEALEKKFDEGSADFTTTKNEKAFCPFHSHIRKTHPRTPGAMNARIIRRGIPYDERSTDEKDRAKEHGILPERKVGLLFMCYQKKIDAQFEQIQRGYCNSINYPSANSGYDPIIGNLKEEAPQKQRWIRDDGNPVDLQFEKVVWMRGGEYFYAPSIPHLLDLEKYEPTA